MPEPVEKQRSSDREARTAPAQNLLFVVSRLALDKYLQLEKLFAEDDHVLIILDRRLEDRRGAPRNPEGRCADRRSRPLVDDRLRRQGWVMVRLEQSQDSPDASKSIPPGGIDRSG
jgi:hypothetical protein